MYIPGRFRTASKPFRTWMLWESYEGLLRGVAGSMRLVFYHFPAWRGELRGGEGSTWNRAAGSTWNLEPHGHHDVQRAFTPLGAQCATAIGIVQAESQRLGLDSRGRFDQVPDIEPDFHGLPLVFGFHLLDGLLLIRVVSAHLQQTLHEAEPYAPVHHVRSIHHPTSRLP